jgi:hypothetical protein
MYVCIHTDTRSHYVCTYYIMYLNTYAHTQVFIHKHRLSNMLFTSAFIWSNVFGGQPTLKATPSLQGSTPGPVHQLTKTDEQYY